MTFFPARTNLRRNSSIICACVATIFCLGGCSGGNTGSSVAVQAPSALAYPAVSITATTGVAVTPDTPTLSGATPSFSISPALPAGLSMSSATGTVSGTPTAVSALTSYTVTASNAAGSTTAPLTIVVNNPVLVPSALSYPQTFIAATISVAIATDTPTINGTSPMFSVSPALPAGLTFNVSTGAISGTPSVLAPATSYTVIATNSAGTATTNVTLSVIAPVAPTLSYSSSVSAFVNVALTTVAPTITGSTPITFSVSPALPTGLSLNTATGAISGTPSVVAATSTYIVSATNAAGSASTRVFLTVGAAANATLSITYPSATIVAAAGDLLPSDVPTVTGTPVSFNISPMLPAGMTFSTSTGIIGGVPTIAAPKASYSVTATNSAGFAIANLNISVSSLRSLLDLGHSADISIALETSTRLLSQDVAGRWVLNDLSSGSSIAEGNAGVAGSYSPYPAAMAGTILMIGVANGVDIRSASDGHLLLTISSPLIDQTNSGSVAASATLAADGTYIATASSSGLYMWSTSTGNLLYAKSGDYSQAQLSAQPSQLQVALGAAGAQVIENISTATYTSSTGPTPFTGRFIAWFSDGSSFITQTVSNATYIYSAAGLQEQILAAGNISGGTGNYFWNNVSYANGSLMLYRIGVSSPVATYANVEELFAGSNSIAFITTAGTDGNVQVSTVDLGTLAVNGPFPFAWLSDSSIGVAQNSASQFAVWTAGGHIVDKLPSARVLTLGEAYSIAGGSARVSACVANGLVYQIDPTSGSVSSTIALPGCASLSMSADGNTLATATTRPTFSSDMYGLAVYSLPSGNILSSTSGTGDVHTLSLSSSGSALFYTTGTNVSVYSTCAGTFTTVSGVPLWTNSSTGCLGSASPDGSRFGVSQGGVLGTQIYTSGQLTATSTGVIVGWIDTNHFVVNNYNSDSLHFPYYVNSSVDDTTGTVTASSGLNDVNYFQDIDANTVYVPAVNQVQIVSSGAALWTGSLVSTIGAVSGSWVVYEANGHIYAESR